MNKNLKQKVSGMFNLTIESHFIQLILTLNKNWRKLVEFLSVQNKTRLFIISGTSLSTVPASYCARKPLVGSTLISAGRFWTSPNTRGLTLTPGLATDSIFCLLFLQTIIDLPRFGWEDIVSSSNSLVLVFDPWRALWADMALQGTLTLPCTLLSELQIYKERCAMLC